MRIMSIIICCCCFSFIYIRSSICLAKYYVQFENKSNIKSEENETANKMTIKVCAIKKMCLQIHRITHKSNFTVPLSTFHIFFASI